MILAVVGNDFVGLQTLPCDLTGRPDFVGDDPSVDGDIQLLMGISLIG